MIAITIEQTEKIRLLDRLLGALSIEQIRQLSESEEIIAKLKGTNDNIGILQQLVSDSNTHAMELMNLRNELYTMKSDLQSLIKLTLKPYEYNSANDAQSLKSKYSIY